MKSQILAAMAAGMALCVGGCGSKTGPAAQSQDSVAAAAPAGPRISYDKQCFTINGKDILIYSGAFHYFRCPKPLWADRFAKMKAAGLNTVETYVAWNWHEQQPPADVDDFSKVDMTDLNDWLKMAIDQFGFNVILRPGPYICAEWDGGGYPQWLITKKPAGYKGMWFRGDDPTYLAWCKHWYTAVAKVAVPWQITHQPAGKPGVILWQLENEYNYDTHPTAVKLNQLLALAHDSRDLGIDVPLLTCVTEDPLYRQNEFLHENVWDTRNEYPKYGMSGYVNSLEGQGRYQPDKPRGISELQGGWFAQVSGVLSEKQGFNAAHITHITLEAWAHGFTSTSYYMMFGGTNLGDWAANNIITSYDYAAPIRESGGTWDRYFAVAAMGRFIADHGPDLARSSLEDFDLASRAPANVSVVVRKSDGGNRYLFLFNESREDSQKGTLELTSKSGDALHLVVNYDLKPFESKILYLPAGTTDASQGQWLPSPVEPPQRPTNLPASVAITSFQRMADPGPTTWATKSPDAGEEADGIYDRRYVYYRADLPASATADKVLVVKPELRDSLAVDLNGQRLKSIRAGWGMTAFDLAGATAGGKLTFVYENPGRGNGGDAMEAPSGIRDVELVDRAALSLAIGQWRMKIATDQPDADIAADVDDSQWPTLEAAGRTVRAGQTVIYRAHFDLTEQQLASGITELTMPRMADESRVYVNGHKVELSTNASDASAADIAAQLHPGGNVMAIVMVNRARAPPCCAAWNWKPGPAEARRRR